MSVLQHPVVMNSEDLHIWDNSTFGNGESEGSTKENHIPSMVESPVSIKALVPIKPHNANTNMTNIQPNTVSQVGTLDRRIHKNDVDQLSEERNLDSEIEEIEKAINKLSSRLESLQLEKVKRNAKTMEKHGRVVVAEFIDPPKQSSTMSNVQSKIEESQSTSDKLKTPRRKLSLGPAETMRGARRDISLGPAEIYSATKSNSNRRKSCYWKPQDIDELRATKERGKTLSLSPKSRSKTVSKVQASKQAATTIGSRKTLRKENGAISSIQPQKLFVKDGEESASVKKPLKPRRVVSSRYNQIPNGGNSAIKEHRKRSLSENEEDCKRWEITSEVTIQKGVDYYTPLSVSEMLDMVPKIKTIRCMHESPRDSGPAKRVSELVGRKSYFSMDDVDDDEVEEPVGQALDFARISKD